MKLIKNVQNVTSLVANKKQTTPVRCYFYWPFHCTTSCSWHTQSLNKIYYWEIFHETVATVFKQCLHNVVIIHINVLYLLSKNMVIINF